MARKYGKNRVKYLRVAVSQVEYDLVMEVCKKKDVTITDVLRKALGEFIS